MNTWITADWHLGEDRWQIMQRPFRDREHMIAELMSNHNNVVNADDIVYVNGDVCFQKTPEFLACVKHFNGRKILLRGNHDRVFTDEQLSPYFEQIIPEGEGLRLTIGDIPCNLVHYPTLAVKDAFNLVGHIHSAWKFQPNSMNVGVDVNHFRPFNLDEIPFFFQAVSKFYDRDVWAAYEQANLHHYQTRANKSTYFTPAK